MDSVWEADGRDITNSEVRKICEEATKHARYILPPVHCEWRGAEDAGVSFVVDDCLLDFFREFSCCCSAEQDAVVVEGLVC